MSANVHGRSPVTSRMRVAFELHLSLSLMIQIIYTHAGCNDLFSTYSSRPNIAHCSKAILKRVAAYTFTRLVLRLL
jgi:hypothetical protein